MRERNCICAAEGAEEHLAGCPERCCICTAWKHIGLVGSTGRRHAPGCPATVERTKQAGFDIQALQADASFAAKLSQADHLLALNAKQRLVMRELRVSIILTENKKRVKTERPVEPQPKPHGG